MATPLLTVKNKDVTGGPMSTFSDAVCVVESDDDVIVQYKTNAGPDFGCYVNWSREYYGWAMFVRMGILNVPEPIWPDGIGLFTSHTYYDYDAMPGLTVHRDKNVYMHYCGFLGTKEKTFKYRQQRYLVSLTTPSGSGVVTSSVTSIPVQGIVKNQYVTNEISVLDGVFVRSNGDVMPFMSKQTANKISLYDDPTASAYHEVVLTSYASASNTYSRPAKICMSITHADAYPYGVYP